MPSFVLLNQNTTEIYICMTSMMMLNITIEVSVNIELPLKGRPQAWLGHFWALFRPFRLLGTLGTFRH